MNKIKLIIVDDELTSRNTIKKLLENNDVYEVAEDFQNGKMALDWLRRNSADIMLCDMQMPEMSGVELMRSVHVIDEYLPVIAISGFDDFNYVRGSLVNGASNYILKHELTQKKLLYVLDQVRERFRIKPADGEIYHRRGYCIYDPKEFCAGKIRELLQSKYIDFSVNNVIAIAIGPDYRFGADRHADEYRKEISDAVIDMLSQMLGDQYPYLIHVTRRGHLLLLISFYEEKSTLYMMNVVVNLTRRIRNQMIRMIDITSTIVSGDIQKNLDQAVEQAWRMDSLLDDKLYLGGNRSMSEAVTKKVEYSDSQLPESLWSQLEYELKNHMDDYIHTVRDMLDLMENERYCYHNVMRSTARIFSLFEHYGVLEKEEADAVERRLKMFEEYRDIRSEILEMLYRKERGRRYSNEAGYSPQIMRVLEYIGQNYMSDISLEKCAEMTGISYTYLSKAFKRETGMRFVEYLNRQRVKKAKSLLIRQDVPMKNIAELSGFRNYNYFFKVFKEIEGMTPTEFLTKN